MLKSVFVVDVEFYIELHCKFPKWKEESKAKIVFRLKNEFTNAVQVKHTSEFKNLENQLVYLEK